MINQSKRDVTMSLLRHYTTGIITCAFEASPRKEHVRTKKVHDSAYNINAHLRYHLERSMSLMLTWLPSSDSMGKSNRISKKGLCLNQESKRFCLLYYIQKMIYESGNYLNRLKGKGIQRAKHREPEFERISKMSPGARTETTKIKGNFK